LISLLQTTKSDLIRNGAALALIESKIMHDRIKKALIDTISRFKLTDNIGTLVHACSYFDFSEKLKLFVMIVLYGTDESSMEAKAVISNMKNSFSNQTLTEAYNYLQKQEGKSDKLSEILTLKDYLKSKLSTL